MNPKSVSVWELYGYTDPLSLEWKSGLLARILHSFSNQTESELNAKLMGKSVIIEHNNLQSLPDKLDSVNIDEIALGSAHFSHYLPPSNSGMPYSPCAPVGWRWILLDGAVDSEWIENLNTVLDDSNVLCLSNGERIKLYPGSRILFETDDLANACPSTVSRCSVICMVRLYQISLKLSNDNINILLLMLYEGSR